MNLVDMEEDGPDKVLDIIDKELTKVKYRCFGKIKISKARKQSSRIEVLQREKCKVININNQEDKVERLESIDKEIIEELKSIQIETFNREVRQLEEISKTNGNSAAVFKLRDKILGSKKSPQDPIAVIDPDTGFHVYSPSEIKAVSWKYCVNLLSKKEPKQEYADL